MDKGDIGGLVGLTMGVMGTYHAMSDVVLAATMGPLAPFYYVASAVIGYGIGYSITSEGGSSHPHAKPVHAKPASKPAKESAHGHAHHQAAHAHG